MWWFVSIDPDVVSSQRRRRTVERYTRPARWFHVGIYLTVLALLGTGWWLVLGQEGHPSPLSRLTGLPDTQLHTRVGWVLTGLVVVGLVLGARAVVTFTTESVRFGRQDVGWFLRWPKALLTGQFARHEGHFDPGQRIANLVLTALLMALVVSGVLMALLHGGPTFAILVRVHRWSTYAVTPVLLGHILIASGVLPGYRGVWRSMHLGGHIEAHVARRIWPAWLERAEIDSQEHSESDDKQDA
jgi:cytochrome b subunit of formate dehydrogenase